MKKRIKTRRLTNIYHSNDDDVGDGYNLLSPPLSLTFSPSPSSQDSCQQSEYAKIFEHGVWVLFLLATAKSVFL